MDTKKKDIDKPAKSGQVTEKKDVVIDEHSALNLRVKELELKLHKSDIENRTIKIHSVWKDFKKDEVMSADYLDGVQHALDNYKEYKATAQLNPPKKEEVRKGTRVIDQEVYESDGIGGQ